MYEDFIKHLMDMFLRYNPVNTVRYQSRMLNNAQNNFRGVQVYISDETFSRLNITTGIFVVEVNIYILQQPSGDINGILKAQDLCYSIANNVVNNVDYSGSSLYDYSIVTVAHATDDDAAGVRLTLQLNVPMTDLCNDDEWREEPISQQEEDHEIKVKVEGDKPINLNPTKLQRIPKC